jgi:hypothetical protein
MKRVDNGLRFSKLHSVECDTQDSDPAAEKEMSHIPYGHNFHRSRSRNENMVNGSISTLTTGLSNPELVNEGYRELLRVHKDQAAAWRCC